MHTHPSRFFVACSVAFLTACSTGGASSSPGAGDGGESAPDRALNDAAGMPRGHDGAAGDGPSANCAIVDGTTGAILDASGNRWTLVTGPDGSLVVDENGAAAGFSDQVVELAYVAGVVSQENVAGAWWSWTQGAWTSDADPTATCASTDGGAAEGGPIFTAGSGEQAKMADAFVDTIGANTHFGYYGTNWDTDRDTLIVPGLAKLGIRHVRDGLDLSDATVYPTYADVYESVQKSTGTVVSFDLLMPYPSQYGNCDVADVNVASVLGNVPVANIDSFEGINEWNGFSSNAGLSCGNAWQSDLQKSQPALYAGVAASPQLAAIKVLGPALAFYSASQLQSDATSVGDLSAWMDYGAEHSYPGGQMPSTNILLYHDAVTPMDGTRPFTVTESGYYTMPDGNQGISETAHGKYMSRFFLEYFNAGAARTYVYDLINDGDAAGTSEGNFGLMRNDGSFKPGATAVQDEIALLSDPGPAFVPGQLAYSLGSVPSQVHHALLQKRSGTMYLLLWQEVNSYDTASQEDLTVSPVAVTVDLGQSFTQVNQYDPVTSAAAFASSSHVQQVTVSVADQTLVLEIVP